MKCLIAEKGVEFSSTFIVFKENGSYFEQIEINIGFIVNKFSILGTK